MPKRSDQRIRRNKVTPPTKIQAVGEVVVPALRSEDPHPLTLRFWEAVHESAQTQFYEASDWWLVEMAADELESYLRSKRSSLKLAELRKIWGDLMVSEGDRRRLRLEIERVSEKPAESAALAADFYKQRFGVA